MFINLFLMNNKFNFTNIFWRRLILLKDFYLQCKIETKMTTAGVKNDQLPNNRLEVFKSNTNLQVFKPANSKLILVASEMISKGLVKTSCENFFRVRRKIYVHF